MAMLFDTDTEMFEDGVHEGKHIQGVAKVDPAYLLWVAGDDCNTSDEIKSYIQVWMDDNPEYEWEEVW